MFIVLWIMQCFSIEGDFSLPGDICLQTFLVVAMGWRVLLASRR